MLSQAIEANNLELVTLLVDTPAKAKIKGIRVREHEGVSLSLSLSLSLICMEVLNTSIVAKLLFRYIIRMNTDFFLLL